MNAVDQEQALMDSYRKRIHELNLDTQTLLLIDLYAIHRAAWVEAMAHKMTRDVLEAA